MKVKLSELERRITNLVKNLKTPMTDNSKKRMQRSLCEYQNDYHRQTGNYFDLNGGEK